MILIIFGNGQAAGQGPLVIRNKIMSHFTTVKTKFISKENLVKALGEIGYNNVEVYDIPKNLHGYQGDIREQKAEIIIRRQFVGNASNDIGFRKNADNCYEAIISNFDRSKHNDLWLGKLSQSYGILSTTQELKKKGFALKKETLSKKLDIEKEVIFLKNIDENLKLA